MLTTFFFLFLCLVGQRHLPRVSSASTDLTGTLDVEGIASSIHQCVHGHLQKALKIDSAVLSDCLSESLRFEESDFETYGEGTTRRTFLKFTRTGKQRDCVALSAGSAGGEGVVERDLQIRNTNCRAFALRSTSTDQDKLSKVLTVVPFQFESENLTLTEPTFLGPILRAEVGSNLVHFLNIHTLSHWLVEAITIRYFLEDDAICQISFQIPKYEVALLLTLLEDSPFTPIFVKSAGRRKVEITAAHLGHKECEKAFGFRRRFVLKKLPSIQDVENQFFPKDEGWDPDMLINGLI
ncbi:hypothetical protein QR680_017697 [Steinernema hermaphroditum]|uniref:Uncharacterized protein n=1 Tax=Steinernema hermaphroditum TaxID=289476 RepID=A0AA39HFI4_9BILA|nr:hypothetical protein QR680_017697 [Steinernema hermaphroditum]